MTAALSVAFAAAYLLTPLTAHLARRFGVMDHPRPATAHYKVHAAPTPYLGGVSIVAALLVGLPVLAIAGNRLSVSVPETYVPVAIAALGLVAVGLLDDIRSLPRWIRLVAQLTAAYIAWDAGFRVTAAPQPVFDFGLTMLWIVGITNAFNLLDNMDGLSAGLAGVTAVGFAVIGIWNGLSLLSVVAAALAGASFGFLAHNKHPAKIFMGDAGSLFLGYTLALLGVGLNFNNSLRVTFLVPVIALGVPIFDTTLVVLTRLRHRKPVFDGGRDHVSHRLVKLGLPVTASVGLLYWAGLCLGWLALAISKSPTDVGWILLGLVLALGIFFGRLLWGIPVYAETPEAAQLEAEAIERGGTAYKDATDATAERISG